MASLIIAWAVLNLFWTALLFMKGFLDKMSEKELLDAIRDFIPNKLVPYIGRLSANQSDPALTQETSDILAALNAIVPPDTSTGDTSTTPAPTGDGSTATDDVPEAAP